MNEMPKPDSELSEEFRRLGANLKDALQAAWNSPERERLEHEIKTGLRQAADTLADLAGDAVESETGQKLRSELESLGDRVKSGDLETKIRKDLLDALQKLNASLEGTRAGHSASGAPSETQTEA